MFETRLSVHFSDGTDMPVGKIICLARTYHKHAEEMGDAVKKEPLLFLKPLSAVIHDQGAIVIPKQSSEVHHEVELGIVIKKEGKNISAAHADEHIAGYCLGLDITARITLAVNGEIRQRSSTSALSLTVGEIVAYVSSLMSLERGDIILTGTPEGVGQITAGDTIEAQIENLLSLTVSVVKAQ